MSSAFGNNSPQEHTRITAEARKSFSFAIWIKDQSKRMLDIDGVTLTLVAKTRTSKTTDDSDNLIINSLAEHVHPEFGYARFNLQAEDMNHPVGEYPFAIVMNDRGYTSVIAKGTLQIVPNTEWASVNTSYAPIIPVTTLEVLMRGRVAVHVYTGHTLAPGTTSFSIAEHEKLKLIEDGAQKNVNASWIAEPGEAGFIQHKPAFGTAAFKDVEDLGVPPGGSPGEMLVKRSSTDYDLRWVQPPSGGGGGGSGLDPTGVLAGKVPTANGVDGWSWEYTPNDVQSVNGQTGAVALDLDDIDDTAARLAMTPLERAKLALLTGTPDWSDVQGKPAFGTAALADTSDFLAPGSVNLDTDVAGGILPAANTVKLTQLRGFSSGTSAPSGGADGDLYFQFT